MHSHTPETLNKHTNYKNYKNETQTDANVKRPDVRKFNYACTNNYTHIISNRKSLSCCGIKWEARAQ